jgi:UDP-N-acetylglucosamine 4,6-dehydratase/5-epimerase
MNILITGGTGSIGQALTDKLLNLSWVDKLCIYSRDEHKQETMRNRLKHSYTPSYDKLRFFIGDVRDYKRLVLAMKGIHITIHTAALKIVDSAEYNPFEYIKTNILGTQNIIDAALETCHMYSKVLLLSTDKAVHPINLYGATKLCCEKLITYSNNIMGLQGPKFSVARYGNVANSNGSVIKVFQKQSSINQKLTITDDGMTRFWITLDDAVEFIIKCLNHMHGGEIFVPDMPSFSIKELAMIMGKGEPLNVIGIRPGEKLFEEIITTEEFNNCDYDPNSKIFIINPPVYDSIRGRQIDQEIKSLGMNSNSHFVKRFNEQELREQLAKLGVLP